TGPQKGLMLPPGMAILAVNPKALKANQSARCARYFWDWAPVFERNARGEFPYTPATALIFGLKESLAMLAEEGLENVFSRHARLAEACRRTVKAIGLNVLARKSAEYSNTLTAVCMPEGFDSDAYLAHAQRTLGLPLGPGLGDVKGKIFRIGHLGSLNEMELLGALAGVEMTLTSFGVSIPLGAGLAAAETYLLQTAPGGLGQGRLESTHTNSSPLPIVCRSARWARFTLIRQSIGRTSIQMSAWNALRVTAACPRSTSTRHWCERSGGQHNFSASVSTRSRTYAPRMRLCRKS